MSGADRVTTGRLEPALDPIPATARHISPTDIAQFIRLEQCRRYLRLRLQERSGQSRFMRDYGVVPQSIPPLLTRSGARFEETIEQAIAAHLPTIDCAAERGHDTGNAGDNARVAAVARTLAPNTAIVLFQARLHVAVAGWDMRGDIDILRLERTVDGRLHALIADIKSSTQAKVEHRLQVAFYHEMLATLFEHESIACTAINTGVLYRGSSSPDTDIPPDEAGRYEQQRVACEQFFGTRLGLLEIVTEPAAYLDAVRDLVTARDSTAARVASAPFETIPFHLTYKCDGCLYNEFCMKWAAEHDDLSLVPHLAEQDKSALRAAGVTTVTALARLKEPRPDSGDEDLQDLVPAPGRDKLVRQLAATPPIGPRLDELVHRARRYRHWKRDEIRSLSYIPSKGYGSLPYCDAAHNPNLVRIYIDAQHDYLHDRIYMLGALVKACENGVEHPERQRSIVHLTEGPPDSEERERELFLRWLDDTIRAVVELAALDPDGQRRAPIHLIFFNAFAHRILLDGLARHAATVLGATPLYDFITQLAAFDSPVATFLDEEVREIKNYPMVCQSLQAIAAYLRFDWNAPAPYRDIFRTRLFDFWGKLDHPLVGAEARVPWYTSRARFNSQIPLEYAYAAWGDLPEPVPGTRDDFAPYRAATPDLLRGFHARRLEAMEWIARDFTGNAQTEKRLFDLPALPTFEEKAATLAQALDEFVTIERHVELGDWKAARLAPPERRVLSGQTLIVRYDEADQDPDVAARNRGNAERERLKQGYVARHRVTHSASGRAVLSKEQRQHTAWTHAGTRFRLRLDCSGVDCDLDEVLALSTLHEGDRVVICPRTTVDTRLPVEEQKPFTPTPRQILYGMRAEITRIAVKRDATGRAISGYVEVEMRESRGGPWSRGFVFGSIERPFVPGEQYTLDPDPNNWYGYWCAKVTEGLHKGGRNTLYERLVDPAHAAVSWPPAAREGQERFMAGLDALHAAGALHGFEPGKRAYIAGHGDTPTLLVQGPPGTGKSYATAFAVLSRLQGAMAAGIPYRVLVCCKTHAATDVLLDNIARVQRLLRDRRASHREIVDVHIDARLLDLPLYRLRPRGAVPDGVTALYGGDAGDAPACVLRDTAWCVAAATPGGIYGMIKEQWPQALFGHHLCDLLVLDEASQMNLPEAIMAALPLGPTGHLVVVGDHRQMPPIVKHNWSTEARRSIRAYRSYESLFVALLAQRPPLIQFAESFRLHAAMADFLREEIYRKDGIPYHSNQHSVLPPYPHSDPFVAATLAPEHPIVVVVHDEQASQECNLFEQRLIAPVLRTLAEAAAHPLDPEHGLGVVVPHRAQRAALQEAVPCLTRTDPQTGMVMLSAVDTVERFQGDERTVIVVSTTESDPAYLLATGEFLLDPRRLTVALSRARRKMILVASRSIFNLFSADEETFHSAQLWKNMLRRTCTARLWEGERDGYHVTVWGNA